jgi:uncharacterized protein
VAAAYFVDSSAIVKRYVNETGTGWIRRITRQGQPHPIYLARITAVEVTSAIARRRKGGYLTRSRARNLLNRFRDHLAKRYVTIDITPRLLAAAMQLADTHSLRAYDAVQLAAALELNARWLTSGLGSVALVSADKDLNAAAVAQSLTVDDPNTHP